MTAGRGGGRPTLRLGHSPDPDDAFMWWPLLEEEGRPPAVDTGRFRFEAVTDDIASLNRRAEGGELEITALSCAQYPRVRQRYALTACGSSLGDACGPRLVSRRPCGIDALRHGGAEGPVVAVPGERTSAFGALSLLLGPGAFRYELVPFDRILPRLAEGVFAAGLVIHEGQLTYADAGLHLVEDLGAWWHRRTGLPIPLGVNAIRRDLESEHGPGTLVEVTGMLRRSVDHALEHRETSIRHALRFARGLDRRRADTFVRMYVNRWTLDFGVSGRAAVLAFLGALAEVGITPPAGEVDVVEAG